MSIGAQLKGDWSSGWDSRVARRQVQVTGKSLVFTGRVQTELGCFSRRWDTVAHRCSRKTSLQVLNRMLMFLVKKSSKQANTKGFWLSLSELEK